MPARVRSDFDRLFGGEPRMYRAPGRINIIGEHLDYNGGAVLPSTVDLYTWVAASPRDDCVLDIYLCNDESRHRIALGDIRRDGSGNVSQYLKGVAWALQREEIEPRGCNLVIGGNIPLGGGLSSSASLELALACVLADFAGAQLSGQRMARICHRAEAGFVGMQCGIMDQYVVALGSAGQAMLLDCRSQEYELYPLPADARFLVTHSGVSHRLPAGDYNSRRGECESALSRLTRALPGLRWLADLTASDLETQKSLLSATLHRRCRHVVTECRRVETAVRALQEGDLELLGLLMDESHRSLRDDYEVSCPELDALVDISRSCGGTLGARMMGGGFGGCTITLLRAGAADDTMQRIAEEYGRELGHDPWMHVVGPAGPVARLERWHEP
jgi:galactokinase